MTDRKFCSKSKFNGQIFLKVWTYVWNTHVKSVGQCPEVYHPRRTLFRAATDVSYIQICWGRFGNGSSSTTIDQMDHQALPHLWVGHVENHIWSTTTWHCMMTSSNENIFRVTGPLFGEFTSDRWIPLTKASDAELWCFLWSAPEQTVEWIIETPVIWDAIALIIASL